MLALKERGLPLVAETFQALDKIDLYSPLLSLADALPAFSPKTTLADLDAYRGKIEEAIEDSRSCRTIKGTIKLNRNR